MINQPFLFVRAAQNCGVDSPLQLGRVTAGMGVFLELRNTSHGGLQPFKQATCGHITLTNEFQNAKCQTLGRAIPS